MEEIKIFWEGPFAIEDILNKNKIDEKKYDVRNNDIGLYQIYSSHPLYGDSSLVYIGRTTDKKGFKSRLKNRWVIENGNDSENVQIYLGTIFSDKKKLSKEKIIKDRLIDKAEVLLINALKPAFNSSNIQSVLSDFSDANNRYIIHNSGSFRKLPAVLDSNYYWDQYENYKLVDLVINSFKDMKVDSEDEYYGVELNDYFSIDKKCKIWFGIDFEIWNNKKIPLMFQIYSDDKKVMKKIEQSKKYKFYKYADSDEILDCFYIDDFEFEENENLKVEFEQKVDSIIKNINNII